MYAVLDVCCTRCMLHSVYAVLSVNSWSWHGDREGWLNIAFCSDEKVVNETERDGGWRREQYGRYDWISEVECSTSHVQSGRSCIGRIPRRIGTYTWHIRDGKLTRTQFSLKSPLLMMICSISSHHSFLSSTLPSPKNMKLSHPCVSLHAMSKSLHSVWHTLSTPYNEYYTHCVMHHPNIDCLQACLSSLGRTCCTKFSTFPQLWVIQWIESQLRSLLPLNYQLQMDRLQVLLKFCSIMPAKPISKLASSWPSSESPNLLHHSPRVDLQTPMNMASKGISKLDRLWPPSSHNHRLQLHPQTHSIMS